jgi:phospholipid/cholesterol/gamma-HCH transport system permease protein
MTADGCWLFEEPSSGGALHIAGDWTIQHVAGLKQHLAGRTGGITRIDGTAIKSIDSAGAFVLLEFARNCGFGFDQIRLKDSHKALLSAVAESMEATEPAVPGSTSLLKRALAGLGRDVLALGANAARLLGFLGLALTRLATTILRPSRWRVTATVHHMQQSGLDALPLVSLLSFLIGAVVAFLGATVLRDFGAELFVVDLTTYAFLREFGVLLTAILLAGRTASAFTAQIGTMKSREEIDAIRTLGQDPIVLLVLPRLIALIIMLPLLSVMATLAGLLGGLAVAFFSLDIPVDLYISRVQETATLSHYLTGLSKAPVFAFVIALVGCLEGFKVTGTAQSVGERTTSSVVQSISLVIIINALAAVFFMEMGW